MTCPSKPGSGLASASLPFANVMPSTTPFVSTVTVSLCQVAETKIDPRWPGPGGRRRDTIEQAYMV